MPAAILRRFLHGSNGSFSLSITLWISWGARETLDVPLLPELLELPKLRPVVLDQQFG